MTRFKLTYISIALTIAGTTVQSAHAIQTRESTAGVAVAILDTDRDGVPDDRDKCPDNAYEAAVDADGCYVYGSPSSRAQSANQPVKLPATQAATQAATLNNINFATGSAVVPAEIIKRLLAVANTIKAKPNSVATIQGHTDSNGSAQDNLALSQARAESVAAILIEKYGISANRLKAVGYGEDNPIASNATRNGRTKNRRVVVSFD